MRRVWSCGASSGHRTAPVRSEPRALRFHVSAIRAGHSHFPFAHVSDCKPGAGQARPACSQHPNRRRLVGTWPSCTYSPASFSVSRGRSSRGDRIRNLGPSSPNLCSDVTGYSPASFSTSHIFAPMPLQIRSNVSRVTFCSPRSIAL